MKADQRFLSILGNSIPAHPKASGLYASVLLHERIAYVAGHLPKLDGKVSVTGHFGIHFLHKQDPRLALTSRLASAAVRRGWICLTAASTIADRNMFRNARS
jgi:hypothetical protein